MAIVLDVQVEAVPDAPLCQHVFVIQRRDQAVGVELGRFDVVPAHVRGPHLQDCMPG